MPTVWAVERRLRVRPWSCEHSVTPPPRREQDRSRIVLEEPPGEVASSPRRGAGDAHGPSRALAVLQGAAEQRRHAVVGEELAAGGQLVLGGRSVGPRRPRL